MRQCWIGRLGHPAGGIFLGNHCGSSRHHGCHGSGAYRPFQGTDPVFRHGLCTAGHARSHHRPFAAAVVHFLDIGRGMLTVTLAHTTFAMCYVAVVVSSRLVTFDRSLEEAALDLGATPLDTFFSVTLPIIAPGCYRRMAAWPSHCRSMIW